MERHNWTLGKYDGSEFILGWVYLFVPDWIIVTSDFNLLWGLTSRLALQIFQMENVVWKQNKCFLGCVFLVLRTYQIWGEKNQERNWAVPAEAMSLSPCELSMGHLVGWGVPRGLLSLPSLSCPLSHHNGCGFLLILTADLQPECGTEKGKDARWQSLSTAIPSPSYISNGKGIPNKMLLPVYHSVIPFFCRGRRSEIGWALLFLSLREHLYGTQLWQRHGESWQVWAGKLFCLSPTIHLSCWWAFILPFWL